MALDDAYSGEVRQGEHGGRRSPGISGTLHTFCGVIAEVERWLWCRLEFPVPHLWGFAA